MISYKQLTTEEHREKFIIKVKMDPANIILGKTMGNTPTIYYNWLSFCSWFSVL